MVDLRSKSVIWVRKNLILCFLMLFALYQTVWFTTVFLLNSHTKWILNTAPGWDLRIFWWTNIVNLPDGKQLHPTSVHCGGIHSTNLLRDCYRLHCCEWKKDWVVVNPLTLDKLAKGSPSGASFLLVLMKLFICMTCKFLLHLALLFFFLQIYIDTFLGGKSIHFFTLELSKCLIIFCVRVKFLHFVLTKVKSINRPLSSTIPWTPKSGSYGNCFGQFEISPFEAFWSSIVQIPQICWIDYALIIKRLNF